jgi:hypothetical protein
MQELRCQGVGEEASPDLGTPERLHLSSVTFAPARFNAFWDIGHGRRED